MYVRCFYFVKTLLKNHCIFFLQIYVSVRGTNGAGLSSVGTSNALYMSYLSQGLSPLSHIGVYDVLENSHGDV
jgi:hypothetical protein